MCVCVQCCQCCYHCSTFVARDSYFFSFSSLFCCFVCRVWVCVLFFLLGSLRFDFCYFCSLPFVWLCFCAHFCDSCASHNPYNPHVLYFKNIHPYETLFTIYKSPTTTPCRYYICICWYCCCCNPDSKRETATWMHIQKTTSYKKMKKMMFCRR